MFPSAGPWTADLVTVTIDDLRIYSSVAFGAAELLPTLTVDSLKIVGATVTIVNAKIVTNPCPS